MYKLTFNYDKKGYGELQLIDKSINRLVNHWPCRTGSLDVRGCLKNAIPCETWQIRNPSVATTEIACVVKGYGRKIRLYRLKNGIWTWTRYLIHPDGNKPGTEGCIAPIRGTPVKRLRELFTLLDKICAEQDPILLEVTNE